ncbi:hypothetical protein [uncultured Mucilaginibacter sp.]|uniref:LPD3 domain-containing protein n=1 Tax=uncultured Mucilaginibacter sp. TaxID=797541 RepID=UPI002626B0F8|nr:hypothetical protein [uncultured Mucilaginibacter sp.]
MVLTVCDTSILCRNQQTQKEFRNKIKLWLKIHYLNVTCLNEETGYLCFISNTFIDKATSKFGDVKAHALANLPSIIRNAIFTNSETDNKGRPDILRYLKFESLIDVDGAEYVVWLYVRQTINEYQLYSLHIKI